MPTPDLPLELWLQILSYLPRNALHSMIGVNRKLLGLALDEKYEEVRFIADNAEMAKIFQQLAQFANIAQRVKRLLIRPAFLPAMDFDDVENTSSWKFPIKVNLLNCFKPNTIEQQIEGKKEKKNTTKIIKSGKKALKHCSNVEDLTVVLHDHRLTPPFVSFLNSLWKANSIGPRLRTLRLHMTLSKLPIFLQPLIDSPSILRNLEDLSIDFAPSRFDILHDQDSQKDATCALSLLRSFLRLLEHSLTAISISSHSAHYFSALLSDISFHFPNLKKVELFTIFSITAPQIASLFGFLSKHSKQLEEITIKPYPRQTSFSLSDDSYADWIGNCAPEGFGALGFPQLKFFDVGLREHSETPNAKPIPDLGILAPNLRRLVMGDLPLSFERIDDLVSALGPGLRSIDFVADVLSPQLFDLLAFKVPSLEMLSVDTKDNTGKPTCSARFVEMMRARRYPHWKLKHLRISAMSSCGLPHPSVGLMKNVAEAFSLGVQVDATYRCYCGDAFRST